MSTGIELTLMIGPAVPIPVPRPVIDALESLEVKNGSGDTPSGFQLLFSLTKKSMLDKLLSGVGGSMPPIMRVVIFATVRGSVLPLIDGVITQYEVVQGDGGGLALSITGTDLSTVMDALPFDGIPYPAMPPVVRVLAILAKYAALGVIPMAIPSIVEDLPVPTDRIPRQQGTDYKYVKALARQCGYVFYFEPGFAPATSKAYWGPEIKVGQPQPALNTDMDLLSNVENLKFGIDTVSAEMPIVYIHNKETKAPIPIPIPDITPLNPPLGLIPPMPILKPLVDTAKMSPVSAVMTGLAYASQRADCVSASGSLDVMRYGHVLKSRALVGVRGAGFLFDGLYYVREVTHKIKRGEYKQSFTLSRNGVVSTVSSVPV